MGIIKTTIMKKLLYLFLAITIISCGGDDDSNDSNTNCTNTTINTPSWLYKPNGSDCFYRTENSDGTLGDFGFNFNENGFGEYRWEENGSTLLCLECSIEINLSMGIECCVYEEISNERYYAQITIGEDQLNYEFEKISEDRIRYLQTPTTEIILLKQ